MATSGRLVATERYLGSKQRKQTEIEARCRGGVAVVEQAALIGILLILLGAVPPAGPGASTRCGRLGDHQPAPGGQL
jgi:hypothetical protein